jgi:dipeptidase D
MQEKIINHFISLTKVPHCSQNSNKLFNFLSNFAKERNYEVYSDKVKNILIKKGHPKLALQAHYDMVCMGEAPHIETYIEEGWMYAKNSSLGADNGIAIAMMMHLMDEGAELEFLLTADEEVGLVGAGAIELKLDAEYMLNLDFEDEGIVCIGCAGGADLLSKKTLQKAEAYDYFYKLSISGLEGGHSGVEIHKNIPNAIKIMANFLEDKEVHIASCSGGERRNSIPANINMIVSSKEPLSSNHWIKVNSFDTTVEVYKSDTVLQLLNEFKQGVYAYNEEFQLPDTSINLALLHLEKGHVEIECSSRGMSDEGLEAINEKNINLFKKHGFETSIEYKYPAWKPEINTFTSLVNDAMSKEFTESKYQAIHAGLECGVLLEHYPHIKFASIGPTIVSPHSTHEKVKLDSIEKIFKVVEEVIKSV